MLSLPHSEAADSPPSGDLRTRAEEAEARLAELVSTMPQAYITIDRDWTITFANHQAAVANRVSAEEFVGKNFWTLWPTLIGSEVDEPLRSAMEERVAGHVAYYSGNYDTWFEMDIHPIRDGVGVYYQDVTAHRGAEDALRKSERRYRAFTELNPQLILMADAAGGVTYANHRLLDYLGMTLEETCGTGWRRAVHPEDEIRVLDIWAGAFSGDVEFEAETRFRRGSDGEYLWFWVRGLPVRDEEDAIVYWLVVCVEIDERKTAAEQLKRSREEAERQKLELESLYRTAPIGLALFDPVEFRYLRLNDRQAAIVGLPAAEILGKTVSEIAPIDGLREMFQQVAEGHPVTNTLLEGELPMRPGVHRYWTVNYYPVYGPDGAVQAIAAASLEVTAQKLAERALIESEKLAAVGRLASSISHEINNPLEAVINLLYLAARHEALPEEVRGFLDTAQKELARVSQISTQSLRFHRQSTKPTWVSTADLINSVVDLYRGRLHNSNVQVQAKYTSAGRILCFENDIRQVLNNLIANAFDSMRQGGRLLLRTHDARDPRNGRKGVRLTVADTGHGISSDAKMRLFEAFYTTKDINGTGLGLWISRGIVARHQGRLSFRSDDHPGHNGTVFSLFLPERATIDLSAQTPKTE